MLIIDWADLQAVASARSHSVGVFVVNREPLSM